MSVFPRRHEVVFIGGFTQMNADYFLIVIPAKAGTQTRAASAAT
jgi:hypothetical protein